MAVTFSVPKAPKKSVYKIDTFLGADFTNSPANVDDNKSPNLINMIRDVPGKIRKCMGYETVSDYSTLGFNYDDVVSDVKKTITQGDMTISIKNHLMDFTFTDITTTTIDFSDGKDIFDQDLLSTYYSYFGDNNILQYIRANMDLPEWITEAYVQTYTEGGETYYTLRFVIVSATPGDSITGLELKFINPDILESQVKSLFSTGAESQTRESGVITVNKLDDSSFQVVSKNAPSTATATIIFDEGWVLDDERQLGTRLKEWFDYYQNPDWNTGTVFSGDGGYRFYASKGTYDLRGKFISSDIESSIFSRIFIVYGHWDGDSEHPYYTVVFNVSTNKDSSDAPFMTLNLLEDPTILDVDYPNNVSLRSAPSDSEEDEPGEFQINGFHKLRNDDYGLVHSGTKMYRNRELLYSEANNHRSMSWEFDEHLYIVDGKKFLRYGLTYPESDIRFKADKRDNNVVINEEVGIVIQRFNTPNYALTITASSESDYGRFEVSSDNTTITYYDKLTEVDQDVEYYCSWSYKQKKTSTVKTGSITTHHLIGISDEAKYEIVPVETLALTPLVTISKDPDGGGTALNDLNLLTPAFTEQFLPKQNTDPSTGQPTTWMKDYYLSFDNLDEVEPIVKKLNDITGEWEVLELDTDYTVDYEAGCISFVTAPSYTGEDAHDRIAITAYRTVERYTDMINKCTFGTLFGVGGANDRLFLSGNPDYINYDWYSGAYNLPNESQEEPDSKYKTDYSSPTYFPDTGYATLGSSGSAVVGYSRVSNYLAAHKDKYERDQNIIIREGDLVDSEPSFRIINTLQGAGAVATYSFAYLETEPVFLTEQGVYAVTAQDITGEKYAQNRSYFLDGKLLNEDDLSQAFGFVHNSLYWLCLNDVAYILDGLQPIQTDKSKPYATRQYAGFYRTNIPAHVMWEDNGRLFFGTKDGRVCRFYKDKYDLASYNDDGEPIVCNWETPDIIGQLFFKNKTLRDIAIKLDTATAASVNIYAMDRGMWRFVRTDHWRARIFQFSTIVFSKFTFNCDKTQRSFLTKFRVKKVDKFRLRLTNDQLNESFALYDVGFEYVEKDNYTR